MTRSELAARSRGVGAAVAKRLVFILLGLLVFQVFNLQFTVNSTDARQQDQAQERLRKALSENQAEHAKTQRYIRCIVLLPIDQRTDTNFGKCGETGVVDPLRTPVGSSPQAQTQSTGDTARTQQPTTGSPPDAVAPSSPTQNSSNEDELEPEDDNSLLGGLPILGPLLGGLGL